MPPPSSGSIGPYVEETDITFEYEAPSACKFGQWYDMIGMEKFLAPHIAPHEPLK